MKIASKKEIKSVKTLSGKYFEGIGRRKTSIARVRLFPGEKGFFVNGLDLSTYFPPKKMQDKISTPFKVAATEKNYGVSVLVKGGGKSSQAEAVRHGLSRALVSFDKELRSRLKKAGFLKRDPRMVERKKYGLKKARRSPQWQKR
ncbi:MAG: 30S ribosomal protein S9 [Candidatus Liptonbacteria bacterium RIFOXYC1_FULL_36_8]|uniref:Small ribosomal subunit protein uS9 n=3 Tax=Candidatus Liptoniibacteriota TaxID=1817909 RepID=A0A1G2CL84_9BACT|nr:MAG: 30S ribosomal protein S9 [Candidatus Liptonbacteria bacterium RIFOXYB1_FULL_36_10]OGZ04053.1 MAG: 30S ribosomal protein S9 [Candidatus Liptonbacteria bacterium RIFOXYC1_FULL_36_8]OGZ04236.1 MAG: 30S ribosomal protein S9 [Candidatus Liptonbacteria bacterium RIFOXYD1_FULL_36_11]